MDLDSGVFSLIELSEYYLPGRQRAMSDHGVSTTFPCASRRLQSPYACFNVAIEHSQHAGTSPSTGDWGVSYWQVSCNWRNWPV